MRERHERPDLDSQVPSVMFGNEILADSPAPRDPSAVRRSRVEARRRSPQLWKWLAVGALAVVIVAAAAAAYSSYRVTSRMAPSKEDAERLSQALDPIPVPVATGTISMPAKEPIYILLMGDDRRSGETRARSDTLMLARVDREKKAILLISIPRDTRVTIEGHGTAKINAAYAYGGPALAVKTVQQFTGLPVNHYMEIDFNGLTRAVDVQGGIWIDVDRNIHDEYRAMAGDGVVSIDKGYQKLNGAQALTYVRSRWFPEGDFVRVLHQRTFLFAFAKQAFALPKSQMPALIDAVSQNLVTDMSIADLTSFAKDLKGMSMKNMVGRTVPGRGQTINGGWYLIPDETRTKQLFDYAQRGEVPPGPVDTSYR
jgi:LCP family protein required for cell wall assembly